MKITAYNKDVQKYMTGNALSSSRKNTIIEHIEQTVSAASESFERLFPSRSKRKDVMDHIIYLLSGNGICKIAAKTLAEKADCSIRTVSDAVKNLKETGEVLVAGLADGKNKYVFVLKSHENFKAILKDVFYINAEQIAEENAEHIAKQENSESLEAVSVGDEKTGPNNINSINSFSSLKQEKNNDIASIQDSIENELKESQNDTEKEFKRINEYYVNEYQEMMYYTIKGGSYHKDIKLNASLIGLRVGSNCDKAMFSHALKAVLKIDQFLLNDGVVTDSVQALFSKIYQDSIKSTKTDLKVETSQSDKKTEGIFYNWLKEDGSKRLMSTEHATKEELDDLGVF